MLVTTAQAVCEPPSCLPPVLSVITGHRAEPPVLHSRFPPAPCFMHSGVYVSGYSPSASHPPLCLRVHLSVLYVWVSAAALQIGATVPSF